MIAYFCRAHAVNEGLKLKTESNKAEITPFIIRYLDILEQEKCLLGDSVKQDNGRITCENFAYSIFSKADDIDRAGLADRNTAKTFYAASTFFDILEQFGTLDQEV